MNKPGCTVQIYKQTARAFGAVKNLLTIRKVIVHWQGCLDVSKIFLEKKKD